MGAFRKRFGAVRFELCFTPVVSGSAMNEHLQEVSAVYGNVRSLDGVEKLKQGISDMGKECTGRLGEAILNNSAGHATDVLGECDWLHQDAGVVDALIARDTRKTPAWLTTTSCVCFWGRT